MRLILAYHRIGADPNVQMVVSRDTFVAHLDFLERRHYRPTTFSELVLSSFPSARRREKIAAITFDDAAVSVLEAACLLEERAWPATVFAVTNFARDGQPLEWPGLARSERSLNLSELQALSRKGWEVGSHTRSHPLLTTLDDRTLADELGSSRQELEATIGYCSSVAYPYGRADERVANAAQKAGYIAGCTLTGAHFEESPLLQNRVGMRGDDLGLRLYVKLSPIGLYSRRSLAAHGVRRLRRRRPWLPQSDANGVV